MSYQEFIDDFEKATKGLSPEEKLELLKPTKEENREALIAILILALISVCIGFIGQYITDLGQNLPF